MGEVSKYDHGQFCWIEAATSDLEAATAYYTTLFGWTVEDRPGGDQGIYRLCRIDGKDVTGLYEMSDEERTSRGPGWNCYVAVDDVDATAKRAEALGGRIIVSPSDVMELGRMAVIGDPSGATVGLWQAGERIGSELENDPGSLTWVELQAADVSAASSFYGGLFGWEEEASEYPGGDTYTTFKVGDSYRAGMIAIPPDAGDWSPAWLPYIETEDVDGLLARSDEIGGTTLVPARSVEGVGRFAVLRDPQGAVLAVMTSAA
jgi:predicted enzyme related to lactoylglutathione lyase